MKSEKTLLVFVALVMFAFAFFGLRIMDHGGRNMAQILWDDARPLAFLLGIFVWLALVYVVTSEVEAREHE